MDAKRFDVRRFDGRIFFPPVPWFEPSRLLGTEGHAFRLSPEAGLAPCEGTRVAFCASFLLRAIKTDPFLVTCVRETVRLPFTLGLARLNAAKALGQEKEKARDVHWLMKSEGQP